jgi:hypothetical protein
MTPYRDAYAEQELEGPVMQLHAPDLLVRMAAAVDAVSGCTDLARARDGVRVELGRLAEFLALLERRRREDRMDEEEARIWAGIAVHQARTALRALEPSGLRSASQVMVAALTAVRGQVNRAVMFEAV